MHFFNVFKITYIGLLLKQGVFLLAKDAFITHSCKISHNFGGPRTGRFCTFFPMGDSVPKMIYSIQTILIYNNTKTFFLSN